MELWLEDTAKDFWRSAGLADPFPRDMERAIINAVPAAVVYLPRLWTSTIDDWLADRQLAVRLAAERQRLRGCMLAYRGRGLIFVDGTDPEPERRFTLAHEVAHLLVDYLRPRHRVFIKLGGSSVEVLDGLRTPLVTEQIDAGLLDVDLNVYTHLMPRASSGAHSGPIITAENRADLLALELLAPASAVRNRLPRTVFRRDYESKCQVVTRLLSSHFGLPKPVAVEYGAFLSRRWFGGPSVREWLGIA
jgi:hypothetical protein